MYQDKVVAAIKVNGRVLREQGDTVSLPFGCEYSILVKNLNSVRAQITIAVDGADAAGQLVIAPNSSIELERFIRNGNLQSGNRFKFIERTAEVEAHRGIGSDDGLIRVEAWRERVQQFVDIPVPRYYDDPIPVPRPNPYWPYYPPRPYPRYRGGMPSTPMRANMSASLGRRPGQPTMRGPSARPQSTNTTNANINTASMGDNLPVMDCAFDGITVPGSESRQQFRHVSGFPLEPQSTVIVLRLRGAVAGATVETPVTVDLKPECSSCGKTNKADSQYCARCGTALVMY